ncbi:radical SAM family protein [Planctomycetaceae bacterium SCGC AG-212-F19]|nr:radical SAM family protein [Planctomycetaceae bacterium SCGC AG-212-F19]
MRTIENLELHVVHSCNLTCESCSHYSNQGHKGMLTLEDADRWMKPWRGRIKPQTISLLGGEPTIHPELSEFIPLVRQHWPDACIRLVTNGLLLHRHPRLPAMLQRFPSLLEISVHHPSPEYRERFKSVRKLVDGWVNRYAIQVVFWESYRHWTRRYRGFGSDMEPFEDNRPEQSWQICPAKNCKQLYQGTLWKCAPLAYLPLQAAKYRLSEKWDPYLAYQPLRPDCTDGELDEFLGRESESYCSMCSAYPRRFDLPLPFASRVGLEVATEEQGREGSRRRPLP